MFNTNNWSNDLWENEKRVVSDYRNVIPIGIDEAGRGCLAGPVVAAAVCYHNVCSFPSVADSKVLSPKKRWEAYQQICQSNALIATSFISPTYIDKMNILNATKLAMRKCISQIVDYFFCKKDNNYLFLIDGNQRLQNEYRGIQLTVVKGDSLLASIASASIVAKVERDQYMCKMDTIYPDFGFKTHKGYGTKKHFEAINKNGFTAIHRRTFLKGKK